ncbi:hypothetical protein PUN28_015480 [Cardiocondyla obscurior]|uniref:Uncharacterized protein n=1 Tax=Cardiocondyla obscurior TaxID=286306 RepID=A0AAW2ET91_9HYME
MERKGSKRAEVVVTGNGRTKPRPLPRLLIKPSLSRAARSRSRVRESLAACCKYLCRAVQHFNVSQRQSSLFPIHFSFFYIKGILEVEKDEVNTPLEQIYSELPSNEFRSGASHKPSPSKVKATISLMLLYTPFRIKMILLFPTRCYYLAKHFPKAPSGRPFNCRHYSQMARGVRDLQKAFKLLSKIREARGVTGGHYLFPQLSRIACSLRYPKAPHVAVAENGWPSSTIYERRIPSRRRPPWTRRRGRRGAMIYSKLISRLSARVINDRRWETRFIFPAPDRDLEGDPITLQTSGIEVSYRGLSDFLCET